MENREGRMRLSGWLGCVILTCFQVSLFGQNIYDSAHTRQFADYLFKSEQYGYAATEYERLLYFDTANSEVKLSLLKCYRLNKDYTNGLRILKHDFGNNLRTMPVIFADEYLKFLMLSDSADRIFNFLDISNNLDFQRKTYYRTAIHLMHKNWYNAGLLVKSIPDTSVIDKPFKNLVLLTHQAQCLRYKKPGLALSFSALLPGSGKVYSGFWKDGMVAFLFVAGNAWQSYRGFHKYGVKSTYGWIFGSIAFGFYCGNLYGSFKAAQKYNYNLDENLRQKAQTVIYSGF